MTWCRPGLARRVMLATSHRVTGRGATSNLQKTSPFLGAWGRPALRPPGASPWPDVRTPSDRPRLANHPTTKGTTPLRLHNVLIEDRPSPSRATCRNLPQRRLEWGLKAPTGNGPPRQGLSPPRLCAAQDHPLTMLAGDSKDPRRITASVSPAASYGGFPISRRPAQVDQIHLGAEVRPLPRPSEAYSQIEKRPRSGAPAVKGATGL